MGGAPSANRPDGRIEIEPVTDHRHVPGARHLHDGSIATEPGRFRDFRCRRDHLHAP
jgi:hypothetical protein